MNAQYDFFIAHTSLDRGAAEQLYDLLSPHATVFLDSRNLEYGDDWDIALQRAQQQSRVTVILISRRVNKAYYQREEIASAIRMSREDSSVHRVVPLYIEEVDNVPYGLAIKHSITLEGLEPFDRAANELLGLLMRLKEVLLAQDNKPRVSRLIPSPSSVARSLPGKWESVHEGAEAQLVVTVFPDGTIEGTFEASPNCEFSTRASIFALQSVLGGCRARWWQQEGKLFVQLNGAGNQALTHAFRFFTCLLSHEEDVAEINNIFEPVEVDLSYISNNVLIVGNMEFQKLKGFVSP